MRQKTRAAGRWGAERRPRRRSAWTPPDDDRPRSWREAFERDPSALGGAALWLLPFLELGRIGRAVLDLGLVLVARLGPRATRPTRQIRPPREQPR
ncbi:MAG TPA: hypothetical protein VF763_04655 [Candidatus Limnocylindrales bacterium]